MTSAWEIDTMPKCGPLADDTETDVCIIGGGLAGLWCAYLLSKEGKKVVLIDKDSLGQAATLYTTAFITQSIDTSLTELEEIYGKENAKLVWQSGADAIELIDQVIKEEKIECEFKRLPIHLYAGTEKELDALTKEGELARELGFEARMVPKIPRIENIGALQIESQAKYHPMKFFVGLLKAAEKSGVRFYENTEAREIVGDERPIVITTKGNHITAKDIVVATYQPFNNPRSTKLMKGMYVSYVYELELPKGALQEGMYLDQKNPYHYIRVDDLGESMRMILGGEDHRAELKFLEHNSFEAVKKYIQSAFPDLSYKIQGRWSGEILEPTDGLPLIGAYAKHQYVATAFSGNGMTYSAVAGQLMTDLIFGRSSPYRDIYHPGRNLEIKALLYKFKDYAGEFFGGAVKNLLG